MTDEQKRAFAIGYLRGISTILWSLDRSDSPVRFIADDAAYYDQQVDVVAKALLDRNEVDDD